MSWPDTKPWPVNDGGGIPGASYEIILILSIGTVAAIIIVKKKKHHLIMDNKLDS